MQARRTANEHTRFARLDANNVTTRFLGLEESAHSVESTTRASSRHKRVNLAACLLPNLGSCALKMRERIVFAVKLIGAPIYPFWG